ncbi:MAG: efflux RND transporter permease subunit [Elusimicrobia bacterium]|nr:efflux RND transporter permease subunit [Elusimicrobiota bacterium]
MVDAPPRADGRHRGPHDPAITGDIGIRFVSKDFIPPDDAGEFQVTIKAPEGTSIKAMDRILEQIEAEVKRLPAVESLLASIGEEPGARASTTDWSSMSAWRPRQEGRVSQFVVMALARKAPAKYEGLRIAVTPIAAISGGRLPVIGLQLRDLRPGPRPLEGLLGRHRRTPQEGPGHRGRGHFALRQA